MATKKDAATEPEQPAATGGRRKKLLVAAGPLVLALVAAWYFVLGPGSVGTAAAEKPGAAVEHGEVVPLEPITMNLADGRLLKVGLALQLPLEPASEHEVNGSVALDEAITFLGQHTYEQLAPPAARQKAKQQLSHRVAERYHHDVLEVYFTEFVMQ
jgi:flagellar FliL protein